MAVGSWSWAVPFRWPQASLSHCFPPAQWDKPATLQRRSSWLLAGPSEGWQCNCLLGITLAQTPQYMPYTVNSQVLEMKGYDFLPYDTYNWAQCHEPIIPASRRWGQEDQEFQVIVAVDYTMNAKTTWDIWDCLKNKLERQLSSEEHW